MEDKKDKGITVKKSIDMPEWYGQVIIKAELADYSPVRGTMIIRPYGYALWQKIMDYFNERLKKAEVQNAYFPLFIPESFFKKEADHAKGFAPEVAWVENKDENSQERLALRPTSETIMYDSYSRWIRSHRDLPLRINQWCNIVRWEVKDVKLFLRSREFLWQEGHCVYATLEECDKETLLYLDEYESMMKHLLALPVIKGKKSESEKFAGALYTTTAESFMPDGKFLQVGTSHNLGQGFARAFGIKYVGQDEQEHLPWQNSWGFSTRLIGALVMMHGDDKGLVLPPEIAPIQAVIVPIIFDDTKEKVLERCQAIKKDLIAYETYIDDRDEYTAGWKFNQWEMKGVPLRIELGPKDLKEGRAVIVRRDTGEKIFVKLNDIKDKVKELMKDIHNHLYDKAHEFIKKQTRETEHWNEFMKFVDEKKVIYAPFCGRKDCEEEIKAKTKGANSRCIPFNQKKTDKKCVHCKRDAVAYAYFGKCY